MPSSKKSEVDYLNMLFCLLVICIHLLAPAISQLNKDSWQYITLFIPWRLASFVVPGFIMLSGIKIFHKYTLTPLKYWVFIKGRILKILVPYSIAVTTYYSYFIHKGDLLFDVSEWLEYLLLGNLVSHFYFVVIIMQFYLLLPFFINYLKRYSPIFVIPLSIFITLLFKTYLPTMLNLCYPSAPFAYNDRVFTSYLMYWVIGCYIGLYSESFKALVIKHKNLLLRQVLCFALCELILGIMQFSRGIYIPFLESIHVMYILTSILALFAIAQALPAHWVATPILSTLNRCSYTVYLFHCLFIFIMNDWLYRHSINDVATALLLRSLGVCLMISMMLGASYWRHKFHHASKHQHATL